MLRVVYPALHEVCEEFKQRQYDASLQSSDTHVELTVLVNGQNDFTYAVYLTATQQPDSTLTNETVEEANAIQTYYRAEVHLSEGGQDYDLMGWSKDGVIMMCWTNSRNISTFCICLINAFRSITINA